MNFIHAGGIEAIAGHLRQLLAQDVENHLNRELYDANLSRPAVSTGLEPEFETPLEIAVENHRQEVREESPSQPYEPMLNLFAAYADEEEAEVQAVESRPSPSRVPSASRKKKGDEPEMFNLFSQENMYDEAATQEDMTGERKQNGRSADKNLKKSGRKKWNHGRLPGRYAPNTRTVPS